MLRTIFARCYEEVKFDMREPQGKSTIKHGTPPTPESPGPSNQIIEKHPDGSCTITTPEPTPEVLAEYEQAIATWPDDAGLRLFYGMTLHQANQLQEARNQLEAAIRLRPGWDWPH